MVTESAFVMQQNHLLESQIEKWQELMKCFKAMNDNSENGSNNEDGSCSKHEDNNIKDSGKEIAV